MSFRKNLVILAVVFVFFPVLAMASDYGLSESANAAGLTSKIELMDFVANIISTVLSLIGVIFLVLFIYGGFMWMTAGGDSTKTKKAKDIMTNAVIGSVLIFSAYFITKFVINELVSSTTIQSGTGAGTTPAGTGTTPGTTPTPTPGTDLFD